ncbi:MAG: hypothetical protein LBL55_08150, partial [Propionibacteriaceae bacterium]|nr:hypothetical protein [Propionibacteriaceae bacterium]
MVAAVACLALLTGCAGDRHLNGDWELGAGGGRLRQAVADGQAGSLAGLSGLRIDGDKAELLVQSATGEFEAVVGSFTLQTDDGRLTLLTDEG